MLPAIPDFELRPGEFILNVTPGKFRVFAIYETRPRTLRAVVTVSDPDTAAGLVAAMNSALAGFDNTARLARLLADQPAPLQAAVRAALPVPRIPAGSAAVYTAEVERRERQEAARFLASFPTLPCAVRCDACRDCYLARFTAADAWSVANLADQEGRWLMDDLRAADDGETFESPSVPRGALGLTPEWHVGLVAAYQRIAAELRAGFWPTPACVAEQWALAAVADEHDGGSTYWTELKKPTTHPAWALLRPKDQDGPIGLILDLLPEVHAAAERLYADTGLDQDVLSYLETQVPFDGWFDPLAACAATPASNSHDLPRGVLREPPPG